MLLVLAVFLILLALVLGVCIAFANGMSDSPGSSVSFWPALLSLALAFAVLFLRHYLNHGGNIPL